MEKHNIAKINEIFESIQGEGKYLGANQIFVRFSNCNLHCKFCDTQFFEGKEYDVQALIKKISDFDLSKVHSISFTGGEPLMFVDFLNEFLDGFKDISKEYNIKIYLETNGTLFQNLKKIVDKIDVISMDIKLKTATGEENKFDINDKFLEIASEVETYVKVVFDNKIEENERINNNLEQQAQAICQQMFIDNALSDWTEGTLSDIADITMGQSPSGNSYNEDKNGTIFFQGRAEFGFRFPSVRLYTTEPKRMAQSNDTLMSVRAPVDDINVAHTDCCIGRGLAAIHSKSNHQSFVLYTMFSLKKTVRCF